jgi:hypothetical protein
MKLLSDLLTRLAFVLSLTLFLPVKSAKEFVMNCGLKITGDN